MDRQHITNSKLHGIHAYIQKELDENPDDRFVILTLQRDTWKLVLAALEIAQGETKGK
jgi:ERCC4-related helicase